jgi:hypothetical protein
MPMTRPWLVTTTIVREVTPYEDGAREDAGVRVVLLGGRTDHIRTYTPHDATAYVVRTLAHRESPHGAASSLGLPQGRPVLLLSRCAGIDTAWQWEADSDPLPAVAATPSWRERAPAIVVARTRLVRLLSDHGRRDPRGVPASERGRLCRQASREAATYDDDVDAICATLVAEQVAGRPVATRGSALHRLLGDL